MSTPTWLDSLLFGRPNIAVNGTLLPWEPVFNFIGGTVVDNPANSRIDITAIGGTGATGATGAAGATGATGSTTISGCTDAAITSPGTDDMLVYVASKWTNERIKYNIGFSYTGGVLAGSQLIGMHRFSKAVTFPANFGPYLGHASEASGSATPTGGVTINVQQASAGTGSWTTIGTISFTAGSVAPTFATTSSTSKAFAQGDCIQVVGPSVGDVTFANFFCTLVGFET